MRINDARGARNHTLVELIIMIEYIDYYDKMHNGTFVFVFKTIPSILVKHMF